MILMSLFVLLLVLGYAYIIWVLSAKESALVKLCGQVISVGIAILVIIFFAYGVMYGSKMAMKMCPMMGGQHMMMGKGMMMEKGMKNMDMKQMMEKMKKDGCSKPEKK